MFLGAMGDPARRRATYEDVLAQPDHVVAEVIHGTLYTFARPRTRHARSSSRLGAVLDGPFDRGANGGPGGWIILDEPELHLGADPDILVPDLAGWRRTRMPEMPDAPYLTLAPDWVCEVVSPSTDERESASHTVAMRGQIADRRAQRAGRRPSQAATGARARVVTMRANTSALLCVRPADPSRFN